MMKKGSDTEPWDQPSDSKRRRLLALTPPPDTFLFHAQEKLLYLLIVAEMTSNFRQEIRYSYYRNDPVKYDLNSKFISYLAVLISKHEKYLSLGSKTHDIT